MVDGFGADLTSTQQGEGENQPKRKRLEKLIPALISVAVASGITGEGEGGPSSRAKESQSDTFDEHTAMNKKKAMTKVQELNEMYKANNAGKATAFGVGMLISDLIVDSGTGRKRAKASQAAEFERHVSRNTRRKGKLRKSAFDSLNEMYKDHSPVPPRQGLQWDAVKHRWTSPDKIGKTVTETQGKKRIRGTGTGMHERSVGGHGKGSQRGVQAGRKFRGATDSGRQEPNKGTHPSRRFHVKIKGHKK